MAITLQAGDKAPAFEVSNQSGTIIRSEDLKGTKIVLYFYPKDNTPTCTVEACNLRDNYAELQKQGYVVLGVSPDSEKKHQNFIKKHELPFDLLVDADLSLHNAYGVWAEKTTFGKTYMGTLRTTFVIDENGMLEKVIDKVTSKTHHSQVLS